MRSKVYKWCIVPQCKSTTIKTPNKLFIYIPRNENTRKKWLKLACREPGLSKNSSIYMCEDHFDLPKDMENYMEYYIMGLVSQVRMRPNCIPTKFDCLPIRRKPSASAKRPYIHKKERITRFKKYQNELEESVVTKQSLVPHETPNGNLDLHMTEDKLGVENTADKSVVISSDGRNAAAVACPKNASVNMELATTCDWCLRDGVTVQSIEEKLWHFWGIISKENPMRESLRNICEICKSRYEEFSTYIESCKSNESIVEMIQMSIGVKKEPLIDIEYHPLIKKEKLWDTTSGGSEKVGLDL